MLRHYLAPLEESTTPLERAYIAQYLKPYEAGWESLPPEEKKRLRIQASTHASLRLAAGESYSGLLLGIVAALQLVRDWSH